MHSVAYLRIVQKSRVVDCAFSNSWYNKIVTNCPSVVIYRIHNFKFHKNIRLWHNFNDWQGRSSIDRGKWRKEEMERPPPRHRFRRFSEEDWQILTFGFLGKLVLSWGKSREHLFHLHCGALVFNGSMDQWYTVETAYKVYVCPRGNLLYMRIYLITGLKLLYRGILGL